ncbi:hypothetical protein VTN00DRAFT_1875 [Thermoascus crustaceus]|uniref:mitochondrial 54S ribosomal protein uL22m n=1 Tax=Thermoascus crustaceus TaxID=5088 RepID=UPI003742B2B0
MATMGAGYTYRHLVRAARPGAYIQPRRTFTYVPYRRAQENGNNGDGSTQETSPRKGGIFSTIKSFLGGKSETVKPKVTHRPIAPMKKEGSLSSDSIFAEDEPTPKLIASGRTPSRPQKVSQEEAMSAEEIPLEQRNRELLQPFLDPRPKARIRWERKMVVRAIRRRGRLTKTEEIMRTERETLCKSHWFKTSVKKLTPLARQIAGKNIDEAILQMRLSKKKAAKDVLEHLKHAKNVAIVRHGMGLGSANGETPKPITITLKSGERKVIRDPTSIYIAQAWVNRGPYDVDYDHRAMGRINILRPPHTGLSVLLKEEKTRIREWQEREEKALRQRKSQLWTQLPDRKITAQSQYYSW